MKTIQLSVAKMHCESCEKLIASELEDLPGIHHSTITTADKGGEVMFDEGVVSEEDILSAVKKAGYDATVVSDQSLLTSPSAPTPEETTVPALKHPQHVKVELQTVADGTVSLDANGKPVFTGKMSDTKSITIDGKEQVIDESAPSKQAVLISWAVIGRSASTFAVLVSRSTRTSSTPLIFFIRFVVSFAQASQVMPLIVNV
jgi:copper chaperone CopZ